MSSNTASTYTVPMRSPRKLDLRALADPGLLIPFLEAKVQATFPKEKPTKAILVVYVDARAVASILDRVIGPESWSFQFQQSPMLTAQGWTAQGRLTVFGERAIYREDLGTGTGTAEMGGKGCASDALKRCAVQLGVGRALYALEPITAPCDERKRVAPEQMQRAIVAWRAQLEKWAAKFRAGEVAADAPPAAAETEVPGDPSPPETPGTGRAPARGRHAGGASATQQPASSIQTPSGAPPAAGNQGSAAGATERPVPAAEPLSPGKAQFLTLMEELGIENNRTNRAHAIKALTAHNITSDLLTDRAKVAEAREALRVAFAIPRTATQVVEVPSDKGDGTKYKVTLTRRDADTDAACECEAFKFHGLCKHASSAWSQLGLGDLVDPPIPLEPWEGIDLLEQAKAAGAAYEAAFPEAAAKRKGRKLSAKDESVADKAFGDEPAPTPEAA